MITNIAFKKDTPVEQFVKYVYDNDELKQRFLDGDTIEFAYSKYMFSLGLDNNKAVLEICEFGSDWSDTKSCNIDDMFESAENKYLKLATSDPEKALLELANGFVEAAGIIDEKDKNAADVKLCIILFVKTYDILMFSKSYCDALPAAKEINEISSRGFGHIDYLVNLVLKVMNAINKDSLSDDASKTLYELIDDEFVKKVQQQTS